MSLLPQNKTPLEHVLSTIANDSINLPIPIREIHDVDACPPELLPFLAWSLSVDYWDSEWSDAQQRDAIRESYYIHKHKGTLSSLKRMLGIYGLAAAVEVVEWWQHHPLPVSRPPKTIDLIHGSADSQKLSKAIPQLRETIPLAVHINPVTLENIQVDNTQTLLILTQARQRFEAKVPAQVSLGLSHAITGMAKAQVRDAYQIFTFLHTATVAVLSSNYSHKTSSPPLFYILSQEIHP